MLPSRPSTRTGLQRNQNGTQAANRGTRIPDTRKRISQVWKWQQNTGQRKGTLDQPRLHENWEKRQLRSQESQKIQIWTFQSGPSIGQCEIKSYLRIAINHNRRCYGKMCNQQWSKAQRLLHQRKRPQKQDLRTIFTIMWRRYKLQNFMCDWNYV